MFFETLVKILSKYQTERADILDIYFCYRLLLGRKADAQGWKDWKKRVAEGMTCSQLANGFLKSHEFRMKHTFRKKVQVEASDFVIFADPDDVSVGVPIIEHEIYEQHVTNTLKKYLKSDSVYVDVGCNIGWFVLLAATIATEGKVFGVEPNHQNLQLLYRSIHENHFSNITIFPYAATDSSKLLKMSGFAGHGFVHNLNNSNVDYVQGHAIDDLLKDVSRIDIIKMDIEGHEPIALEGMKNIITRCHPIIISEFHPKAIKEFSNIEPRLYLDTLKRFGYKISVIEASSNILECSSVEEIIDYWHNLNEMLGMGDRMHLDLLAIPEDY